MLFAGMAVVMPVFLSAKKCVNVVVSVSRNVRLGFLADKKKRLVFQAVAFYMKQYF